MAGRREDEFDSLLGRPSEAGALERAEVAKQEAAAAKRQYEATISELSASNAELRAALSAIIGTLDRAESQQLPPIEPLGARTSLPEAAYMMQLSDWHVGERVRPQQIGYVNEYTPEIAQERAEQYFRSNLTMLQAARSAWDVKQLVWWWGGDIITGYIHEEYEAENYLSPTEEIALAFQMLHRGVRFVLDHFDVERIRIVTSNGNHGRGQKKKRTSDFRTSYEYLLYGLMAQTLANEERVEFQIGQGYVNRVDVYGFQVDYHHGDEINYGGGVGGIAPPLYRRIHRVNAGSDDPAHLDVLGHFHQLGFLPRAFVNGSLIGYNAFAASKGFSAEEPMQSSFVIDAKHKVPSNMNPILCRARSERYLPKSMRV